MILKKFFLYAVVFTLIATISGVVAFVVTRHFSPQAQKEVVQSDGVSAVPTANCVREGRQDFACYKIFYTDLVQKSGVKIAFDDLKVRYASTPAVKNGCHQITHVLGRAGADLAGGVGSAFALGDAMCWSGYYHGVMEEVLKGIGVAELPAKLNTICSAVPGKDTYSFNYYNCVHGLGHGIMQLYSDDVMASLDVCSKLDGDWEKSSCGGGVFMENIMVEDRGGISMYLKKEDPIYPCNAVPDIHKSQCYLMQTSHMLTAFHEDFTKVFATCDTVEEKYRGTCFESAGRDASGRSVSDKLQTTATCMLGKNAFAQEHCVIGAVKDFVSFFHSDTQAKDFCNGLSPNLKTVCLTVADSYYASFQ